MSDHIIPGAVTVAVTSGKGGVGKSTTAVALAAALADHGIDVVVLDADIDGPNVHLIADVTDTTLGVDTDQLKLRLPTSPHGFRVVTPDSIQKDTPAARVDVSDLVGIAQFADPARVVIVDLPPGWTDRHDTVCGTLPELVVAVVAPTRPALSDHDRHIRAWTDQWEEVVRKLRERDRRRKLDLPAAPQIVAVETMARFTGVPDTGGDPITVRRHDAVPADQVADLVGPVVSIPAAADIAAAARTPEIAKLADQVLHRAAELANR